MSSDIRNEIIEILADMVREEHATNIRKAELSTIMVDGTSDKNEDTSEVEEKTFNIRKCGRSAKDIFEFVRTTLENRGGLQALICVFCGRPVAYIHCFCHRIHLVVIAVMKNIEEVKDRFGTFSALYDFFKLAAVKEQYSGGVLRGSLKLDGSGHLVACKAITENYAQKTSPEKQNVRPRRSFCGLRSFYSNPQR